MDADFAEGLHEVESGSSRSSHRHAERKARQFCRQVQQALNLAIADYNAGDSIIIGDLFVEEVSPAPDCGRLLAQVVIPPGRPVADAIAALGIAAPHLRSEVAAAISRKRAPELCFVPVSPDEGGEDE